MNSPFSGRRVLLVEDEMLVVWLLEDMLAGLGCTVMRAVCLLYAPRLRAVSIKSPAKVDQRNHSGCLVV
jgi:CheY-like chemotaxis protein